MSATTPTQIRVYRNTYNEEWLAAHPDQRWQCDIYPSDGSDHHGLGATEAEAVLNAAMHYRKYES